MSTPTPSKKPKIVLSETDHDRLSVLAETVSLRDPAAAEGLQAELSRARLTADHRLAADIVRMRSTVTYQIEGARPRTVTLVYPGEADIDAGRISILTPIGTALLGLSPGQTMPWTTTAGDLKRLQVVAVAQQAPALAALGGEAGAVAEAQQG